MSTKQAGLLSWTKQRETIGGAKYSYHVGRFECRKRGSAWELLFSGRTIGRHATLKAAQAVAEKIESGGAAVSPLVFLSPARYPFCVNPKRAVEELTGNNYGIMCQKLDRIHCFQSVLSHARQCRPNDFRAKTRDNIALRRGWALLILQRVQQNRSQCVGANSGNFAAKATVRATN